MFQLKSSECNYVMLFRFFSESEKLMSEGVPNDSGGVGNFFKKEKKDGGTVIPDRGVWNRELHVWTCEQMTCYTCCYIRCLEHFLRCLYYLIMISVQLDKRLATIIKTIFFFSSLFPSFVQKLIELSVKNLK